MATIKNISAEEFDAAVAQGTVPTLILYKDGAPVKTLTGMQSRGKLVELLKA